MELFKLFGTIAVKNDEANDAIDETVDHGETAESKLSASFKKIGTAVATFFAIDKIVSFGKETVRVAAEVSAEVSAFNQIMGDYGKEASKKVSKIADETGMVDTRLTPYMTSMTAKFKGLGYDIDDATDLASDGLTLAADASAFWDKSLDESMSHLNSFINGSYEGGEAIGLFANDTQLAAYAVQKGIVQSTKDWSALDEATKQATRLEYAKDMYAQSGATGQAAKEAGQYANVQANLTEKWRQFKAQIGEPILQNIVLPAMEKLSKVVDLLSVAFQKLTTWVKEHKTTVQILVTIIAAATAGFIAYKAAMLAMFIIQKVTAFMKAMTIAQRLLNLAMSLNPIGIVIALIAALVTAFVILWNKSDSFRAFWINLWDKIKTTVKTAKEKITGWFDAVKEKFTNIKNSISEKWNSLKSTVTSVFNSIKSTVSEKLNSVRSKVSEIVSKVKSLLSFEGLQSKVSSLFSGIKEKITHPIQTARDLVSSAVKKIKGIFPISMGKIFSGIKLPHFSISGGKAPWGIGGAGTKPSIGIDWYYKAMDSPIVLRKPTIFGMNREGDLMGGGEKGNEVIVGENTLLGMMSSAVSGGMNPVINNMQQILDVLTQMIPIMSAISNMQIVLDNGVLVGQLAGGMDSRLGEIYRLRERGK